MGSLYNTIKGSSATTKKTGSLYETVKNPSPLDLHELRVQELTKKIDEDISVAKKSTGFGSVIKDTLKKVGSAIFGGNPLLTTQSTIEKTAQPLLEKITSESKVGKAISAISKETTGSSIGARIQSLSPKKTYEEAYKALQTELGDPNAPKVIKFIEKLTNALPQQAIGVMLSVLNKSLSTLYWTSLSASEQLENKGKVSSITDLGTDVLLDSMLGASIESLLKTGGKSFISSFVKNGLIEGGTEVTQDLLKLANAYNKAETKEEKDKIVTQVKDYFKSGQILDTALLAGATGGILGGGVQLAQGQQQTQPTQQQVQPQIQTQVKEPAQTTKTLYEAVRGKSAGQTITEVAPTAEGPANIASETKPSGVAKRIEAKAIEQGLIQGGFNQLAEYTPVVIKQQSEVISDLMNSDLENAKKMATGEEKLADNVNGILLFKAMELQAMNTNDGELILKLVNSPFATQGSTAGQTMRLLQEYDDFDPIGTIQQVNSTLETETKRKIKKPKQQELVEIKDTIKKNTGKISKSAWNDFVKDITC